MGLKRRSPRWPARKGGRRFHFCPLFCDLEVGKERKKKQNKTTTPVGRGRAGSVCAACLDARLRDQMHRNDKQHRGGSIAFQLLGANAYSSQRNGEIVRGTPGIILELSEGCFSPQRTSSANAFLVLGNNRRREESERGN